MFDKATVDECIRVVENYARRMRELAEISLKEGDKDDCFYFEIHASAAEAIAMRLRKRVK